MIYSFTSDLSVEFRRKRHLCRNAEQISLAPIISASQAYDYGRRPRSVRPALTNYFSKTLTFSLLVFGHVFPSQL
jgi:hypothetical protein